MALSGRGTWDRRGHHLLLRMRRGRAGGAVELLVEGLRVDSHVVARHGHRGVAFEHLLLLHVLCGDHLALLGVETLELLSGYAESVEHGVHVDGRALLGALDGVHDGYASG